VCLTLCVGQERFRTITSSYYRGADGIVLVYDVTDANALDGVRQWLNEINRYAANEADRVLVGNKIDLSDRKIESSIAEEFARGLGFQFFETSAKDGTGVNQMFLELTKLILRRVKPSRGDNKNGTVPIKRVDGGGSSGRRRCFV
jgi:Ras-related protein Rab-1A